MDNVVDFPGRRHGWWDERKALTASRAFAGNVRVIMIELVSLTASDGFVECTHQQLARSAGIHPDTAQRAKQRLLADAVLRRTSPLTPCRYEWDADRLAVLAGQFGARSTPTKRLGDDNLCSHLRDGLAALEAAYLVVHYEEVQGFAMRGTPPRPRLATKSLDKAHEAISDVFGRLTADLAISHVELAFYFVRKFHKSRSKRLAEAGFAFSFLAFELKDLENDVRKAVAWDRRKAEESKHAAPSSTPMHDDGAPSKSEAAARLAAGIR